MIRHRQYKKISHRRVPQKGIPWRDNSSSMITLYSILSAMVGAILAIAISDKEINDYWIWPISLLAFSIICLINAMVKFSDALDENDVDKYLAWFLAYNLGVILMFLGIASYIYLHFHLCFFDISKGNFRIINFWHGLPYFLAIIASFKWIYDFYYLLFEKKKISNNYRKELLGKRKPEPDLDWLMKTYKFIRKHRD